MQKQKPVETIEDKLKEYRIQNNDLSVYYHVPDHILQAIITTETTNARINTLQELQPCDDHYDSKAVHLEDITAHIDALQKGQNAA